MVLFWVKQNSTEREREKERVLESAVCKRVVHLQLLCYGQLFGSITMFQLVFMFFFLSWTE